MRRTRPGPLALLALLGAVLAWMLEAWLQAQGRPMLVPAYALPATLVVIGIVLVAVAWPIRRYTRRLAEEARLRREDPSAEPPARGAASRPDPFASLRVLALAKASSHAGILLAGACAAILAFVLTRSLIEAELAIRAGVGLAAAAALTGLALLVESWCSLPPEDRATARPGVAAIE